MVKSKAEIEIAEWNCGTYTCATQQVMIAALALVTKRKA
jgi:hypothetical protein